MKRARVAWLLVGSLVGSGLAGCADKNDAIPSDMSADLTQTTASLDLVGVASDLNRADLVSAVDQASPEIDLAVELDLALPTDDLANAADLREDDLLSEDLLPEQDLLPSNVLTLTPATDSFTSTGVGAATAPKLFTVVNTGSVQTGALTVVLGGDTSDFSITEDNCTGQQLAPTNGQCTVFVQFAPTVAAVRNGSLTVSGAPGGTKAATFSGTGLAPALLELTTGPNPADFGTVASGTASSPTSFTLTNTGGTDSGNVSVALEGTDPGEWVVTEKPCEGSPIIASSTCVITVTFNPTSAVTGKSATLVIAGTPGGTIKIDLKGDGGTPAQLALTSPVSGNLDFGSVATGTSSATQDIVVTNAGGATTGVPAVTITGADATRFEITQGCGAVGLAPAASCTIKVRFNPNAIAAASAQVEVTATPGGAIVPVALSGNGVDPPSLLISGTFTFPSVPRGSTSAAQTYTIMNTGGLSSGAPVLAAFFDDPGQTNDNDASMFSITSNDCSAALAPGGFCTVQITFSPPSGTTNGSKGARLRVTAPGLSSDAVLSGTAVSPSALVITPLGSYDYTPGGGGPDRVISNGSNFVDATFTIVNNGGTESGDLSVSLSVGTHFSIQANTCTGASLRLDGNGAETCTITVRFKPTTSASGILATDLIVTEEAGAVDPVVTKTLSGKASAPAKLSWQTQPQPYDFGTIRVTLASAPAVLTLKNVGDEPSSTITVTEASGHVTQFDLTNDTCTGTSLSGGASCTVSETYSPDTYGPHTIQLNAAASTGGGGGFNLKGRGMYRVRVTKTGGTGAGVVASSTPGIDCGSDCEELADSSSYTLTATPTSCSNLGVWTGCTSVSGATCTVNTRTAPVDGTGTITINQAFTIKSFTLTVTKTNVSPGNGTVTSNPAGITCDPANSDCSQTYACGTSVTLTATPAPASGEHFFRFGGWGAGDCFGSGVAATCTVEVTQDRSATATFTPTNKVFFTPTAYTGAEILGRTGADAKCAAAATAAGFANATSYRAWISDSIVDAKDRFAASTRGWVNVDGDPFTDTLTALTTQKQVFYPIIKRADKVALGAELVWTGTTSAGLKSTATCTDWTSTTGQANLGMANGGAYYWTDYAKATCSSARRLLCMQDFYASPVSVPSIPAAGRRMFLSSGSYPMGGGSQLSAMDAFCQADATTAGIGGTWKALVATNGGSAASRAKPSTDFYRLDGVRMISTALLTAGASPSAPLDLLVNGLYATNVTVYNGAASTNANGTMGSTCNNWTSSSPINGLNIGATGLLSDFWSYTTSNCSTARRIYCIESTP